MSAIPLSKKHGLDPHLMYCPRCGQENGELSVGDLYKSQVIKTKQWVYHYLKGKSKLREEYGELSESQKVHPLEKVPGNLCQECKTEIELFNEEVKKGGIYFQCECCSVTGVIKADTNLAIAVRNQMNIKPPNPVGIKFEECSQHTIINQK